MYMERILGKVSKLEDNKKGTLGLEINAPKIHRIREHEEGLLLNKYLILYVYY